LSITQGHDFCVRLPGGLRVTLSNQFTVARYDDTTHAGVGGGDEQGLLRLRQGLAHVREICRGKKHAVIILGRGVPLWLEETIDFDKICKYFLQRLNLLDFKFSLGTTL
jgi:hypothetical protein